MDEAVRFQLLSEARLIGEQLLSQAEYDANGIAWKTMSVNPKDSKAVRWQKTESIYNGVSGIALFLLELYRQTQDSRYLEMVQESLRWVAHYCDTNPSNNYAFFTGRMGVAYAFSRMAHVTGDTCFLEKALSIARLCEAFLHRPHVVDDLINGTSGTLLGLLHLHATTGEPWLLNSINVSIQYLLQKAHHGPLGLYWDRLPNVISGLCGMAHGAAGVGFVFLEVGRYFQNDAFYQVARQAFLYESHFYNPQKKNWPDMRKGVYDREDYEQHRTAYLAGDADFFVTSGDMNAWCHGAAGIGLTRLRAYELLGQDVYKQEAQIAIEKTVLTDLTSSSPIFVLCHGKGGNAELFLEAYRLLKDTHYLALATEIARRALAYKKENTCYMSGYYFVADGEDYSLFMGSTGIGYYYLRLLDPVGTPSILMPGLTSRFQNQQNLDHYPYISLSYAGIQGKLFQQVFPRTFSALERLWPTMIVAHFDPHQSPNGKPLREIFIQYGQDVIARLSGMAKEQIADIFALEVEKARLDGAIKSNAFLSIQEKVRAEQAAGMMAMERDDFQERKIILNPDIRIKLITWNWLSLASFSNQPGGPQPCPIVLQPTARGIAETELFPLAYHVLMAFIEERSIKEVVQDFRKDAFLSVAPDQVEQVEMIIIQQIKQAITAGFLIGTQELNKVL
jgi:hypothetical protein